ncbi:HAMP domain-containing histidine kinase [Rhizobium sp. TRM95111]|uniref:sensor histidine kinase n=1 Tax=Rhizobium alarense TaxID=2846851 RepID=UPI001F166D74|nr:HAMP domain-containing sensor histidine kinase [Rhizobium alarense]MCF3638619.1 HAMP domain-containing histidine kinase [Rhizobium alarense]
MTVIGGGRASSPDAAGDRRLRLTSVAALALVPATPLALSAVLPLSTALPVGAALGAAGVLLTAAAMRALGDRPAPRAALPRAEDPAQQEPSSPYDLFAGLVTLHDERGLVTAVHGRDRTETLAWLRDPAGRGFLDQIHVSDRLGFVQAIDRLRQGAEGLSVELRLERRRQSAREEQFVHMRAEMTARRDAEGAFAGLLVQSRDISGEIALRQENARKASEAESANDAKTRFLAAVSHELRTPLNAILGFSDILAGEYFGKLENDRQREYVALIHQSGGHLLSVVNTMLDVSKIEAGRYELLPEPFAVADCVRACEKMLGLQAKEKGIQLTSRIARELGEANADQRALQQVLINLVGNAIKFTDRGGIVTIDALREADDLVLVVSDTGIGIPADKLSLIGQPFVQVQNEYTRRYEGTGLGLSLVKGLVALHGGSFAIESRPGEGTVITIRVPADGSGIASAAAHAEEQPRLAEFPPRLDVRNRNSAGSTGQGRSLGTGSIENDEESDDDAARAKTA